MSIHSKAENAYIAAEAKKVFTEPNAKIWLGMSRDNMGERRGREEGGEGKCDDIGEWVVVVCLALKGGALGGLDWAKE